MIDQKKWEICGNGSSTSWSTGQLRITAGEEQHSGGGEAMQIENKQSYKWLMTLSYNGSKVSEGSRRQVANTDRERSTSAFFACKLPDSGMILEL